MGVKQTHFLKENEDIIPLIAYTILALWTRLYNIGKSNTVVWDEVRSPLKIRAALLPKSHLIQAHFGKFGAVSLATSQVEY